MTGIVVCAGKVQGGAANCEDGTRAAVNATVNESGKIGVDEVGSGAVNTATIDATGATAARKNCELG